jgi:hypothetical protein
MNRVYFKLIGIAICLSAICNCRKDADKLTPLEDGRTASVNYFGVSQTFPFYSTNSGTGVFVDTVENTSKFINTQTLPGLPYFEFDGAAKQRMYPFTVYDINNFQPIYLDYEAGTHRFIFSYMISGGVNKPVNTPILRLADTTLQLPAKSHNCLYFTDAPGEEGEPATYRIVHTRQPLKNGIDADKVGVQLVNLSADAGPLHFSLAKVNGEELDTNLPALAFGKASGYLAVELTEAQDKQLVFKVYDAANKLLLTTGVPATAGHSFELLIHGLVKPHLRQVTTGLGRDGKIAYKTVTLPISLAATARQTF